ncbi:tetratricopeptide repeat protein [Amycolatopsis sp. BJA-103]|uniref:tetratricopeptide repeat protein n=1 Tax=Amycolatopsis sp. BJA-103 TaxID=1911175 RepID=UPI0011AFC33A|nr:tetratricopeptide repeat protein [Amycolatopsis sp. BJA-103]
MTLVKSNLPAPRYRTLIGQHDIVERALDLLAGPPVDRRVLIHGPAGAGKTSIANEIGMRVVGAAESPATGFAAVIWLSARPAVFTADGVLRSPLVCGTLSDFMTNICVVLGSLEILQALPEEQPAMLQAMLARQPTLVIADDIDEVVDERVLSFLDSLPGRCGVLATSRMQLNFTYTLRVSPLTRPQAAELVGELNREGDEAFSDGAVAQLYKLSGGIPLAVVWSVNLLRLGYSMSYILDHFGTTASDLLRFCFFTAWEWIENSAAADLLMAIALFSAGARADMAYRAAGLVEETPDAESALVRLRRLGLVELSADRLILLPMTRTYIMGVVMPPPGDPNGDDIRTRWADALATYVRESLALSRWQDCFDRIEEERGNLEELLALACTRHGDALQFRAAVLYSDISYYLFSQGYWQLLIEHAEWALPALREQELGEEYLTVLLTWVSRVHLLRGDDESREACFAEAEQYLVTVSEEERPLYDAIIGYNRVTQLRGDPEPDAVPTLRGAAEIFRSIGRHEWLSRAVNRLGNILSANRDFDAAIMAFSEAVAVAEPFQDSAWAKDMTGIGKGNLGVLANRQQRHADAVVHLEEAREQLAQALDDAIALMELAVAHYHLGDIRKAVRFGDAAQARSADLNLGISIAESDQEWERTVLPRLREEAANEAEADDGTSRKPELDDLVRQAVDGGLLELTGLELEDLLGRQLEELLRANAVAHGSAPQWAAGDFGPRNLAARFIASQAEVIRQQVCKQDGTGLKPKYVRMMQPGGNKASALTAMAALLYAELQLSATTVAAPAVAIYIALWLLHGNMARFCGES